VNWQRDIAISKIDGKMVVIKRNKTVKSINEYLLVFVFTFMSFVLLHPTSPFRTGKSILLNEGSLSRQKLKDLGIPTPRLIEINNDVIIEEYIDGGNLYGFLQKNNNLEIVYKVGIITRNLHDSGSCFIDNKAQNYLVKDLEIIRTDLGLIQNHASEYTKSVDIGIFLASLLDLDNEKYKIIEKSFLDGYKSKPIDKLPHLTVIVRNIVALVLVSDHSNLAKNLLKKSDII
jgi:tRNA A-37 threonylcarbamoyl transferase component Bud32